MHVCVYGFLGRIVVSMSEYSHDCVISHDNRVNFLLSCLCFFNVLLYRFSENHLCDPLLLRMCVNCVRTELLNASSRIYILSLTQIDSVYTCWFLPSRVLDLALNKVIKNKANMCGTTSPSS